MNLTQDRPEVIRHITPESPRHAREFYSLAYNLADELKEPIYVCHCCPGLKIGDRVTIQHTCKGNNHEL